MLRNHTHLQVFLSCVASVSGLFISSKRDLNLFKVLIFSRSVVSLLKIGSESRLYDCIRQKNEKRVFTIESLFAAVSCVVICYAFLYEAKSFKKGFVNTIVRAGGLSDDELRFFDSVRAVQEIKRS